MEKVVIDASVVVKWFIEEEASEEALAIRTEFIEGKIELMSPSVLNYEVLNALKYSTLYNIQELIIAATALENYGIIQVPLNGDYAKQVVTIALENDISIYDAAYVGLAEIMETQVYTADIHMSEKLQKEQRKRVRVIIPRK